MAWTINYGYEAIIASETIITQLKKNQWKKFWITHSLGAHTSSSLYWSNQNLHLGVAFEATFGTVQLERIKNESQTKLSNPFHYLFIPQVLQQDNTSTTITHEQNRPSNNTSLLSSIHYNMRNLKLFSDTNSLSCHRYITTGGILNFSDTNGIGLSPSTRSR